MLQVAADIDFAENPAFIDEPFRRHGVDTEAEAVIMSLAAFRPIAVMETRLVFISNRHQGTEKRPPDIDGTRESAGRPA